MYDLTAPILSNRSQRQLFASALPDAPVVAERRDTSAPAARWLRCFARTAAEVLRAGRLIYRQPPSRLTAVAGARPVSSARPPGGRATVGRRDGSEGADGAGDAADGRRQGRRQPDDRLQRVLPARPAVRRPARPDPRRRRRTRLRRPGSGRPGARPGDHRRGRHRAHVDRRQRVRRRGGDRSSWVRSARNSPRRGCRSPCCPPTRRPDASRPATSRWTVRWSTTAIRARRLSVGSSAASCPWSSSTRIRRPTCRR